MRRILMIVLAFDAGDGDILLWTCEAGKLEESRSESEPKWIGKDMETATEIEVDAKNVQVLEVVRPWFWLANIGILCFIGSATVEGQ